MAGMALGDRMKRYESVPFISLTPRMPKIIRIDGKAFHSYTRGMVKPFDEAMHIVWITVMKFLCKNIMGAKLAYAQSDECSILVTDYDRIDTQAWFDNEVQKWLSVAASMATGVWNGAMEQHYPGRMAFFDCRAFALPIEEVTNYFIWRQRDAVKNSISALAHAHFSDKRLHGLNGNQKQELLFQEKGINWAHLPGWQKNGWCVVKTTATVGEGDHRAERSIWIADGNLPNLAAERDYIETRLPGLPTTSPDSSKEG